MAAATDVPVHTSVEANELRTSGVSVSALCPGPTATEFQERARMQKSKLVSGAIGLGADPKRLEISEMVAGGGGATG